ncbi:MAG: cysteine desulfurase [Firmicutes bacterium]|nr:cysteine desulfurase [Bacillota bacterium]
MRIYADHAATTPVRKEVLQAMLPFFTSVYGNPSSLYTEGQEAAIEVEKARRKLADSIGAGKEEILFTSGGTESNNVALGSVRSMGEGRHIIVSAIEHASVLEAAAALEQEGFKVSILPVDRFGKADPKDLCELITDDTALVSCQLVNNETGSLMPVEEMGNICREARVLFHVDAVQGLGKTKIDLSSFHVDLMSLSAHKIGGPKGTGALYHRRGIRLLPALYGGRQERSLRAGTENVPGIIGFGEAARLAVEEMMASDQKIRLLQNELVTGLIREVPGIHFNGPLYGAEHMQEIPLTQIPGYINVRFEGVEGETLVQFADMQGLAISAGSACHEGSDQPSHVLMALGLTVNEAKESVRITLGQENTSSEVEEMIRIFRTVVPRLRRMRQS